MSHTAEVASAAIAASIASGGVESVGFLNDIVAQLWDYINVAGATMTKQIVEPMFKELLPGPLKNLHFTKIDLGPKPIRFDNIDVHSRKEGIIKLDVDVLWDGECDIDLKATVISFGVQKVKLTGRLSVLLCPLVDRLPLVTAAQVAFVNPPKLELDFTGAAQLADFSVIDSTIRKIIQDVLAMILVLPNRLLVKIDPANDYFETYQQHLGFIRLTVLNGHGFVTPKGWIKDIPDVYCKLRVGASAPWKTETKNNDVAPEWNASKDFLLSDHDQRITLQVLDDDLARDDDLGAASITVGNLLLHNSQMDLALVHKDAPTGAKVALKCEIYEFVPDLTSLQSPEHADPDLMCGLATVIVAGAKNVSGDRKLLAPHCKVSFCGQNFGTPMVMDFPGCDPNNPAFDSAFRVPLTAELAAEPTDFVFTLMDRKEKLGSVIVPWSDVVDSPGACVSGPFQLESGAALHARVIVSGIMLAVN
eukprot:GFKZ01003201.1.p1 GENE.GFKZ01003201.1~~GFKZ01003201.1.p1  ORF type:complete len:486 (+),score=60.34 GFKZ01003201.1:32-1459(+)